ncbi:hypothetical protein BDV59DRAFT_208687 [Aspergillus ambiguus]|uniref:Zn(II)2Cys6 transcription factor domain-containing protein n=1 Tax=Aspergillus ambiguus TaxID=176160 RepID=UPI003CCD278C
MQQKACDRCYERKKKCLFRNGASVCVRCEKSSLACTISRLRPRAGRPPKQGPMDLGNGSLGVWDYALPESGADESSADKHQCESPTITFPDLQVKDFHLLDIYMFGPTFYRDFQSALEYCHRHSTDLLDEIFLALESCLSWARVGLLSADQVDVRSGAVSVGKLRNAVISNAHDALAVMLLGQALAAFDSLVTSTGTISILRCSLSLVQPWYSDIAQTQFLEPIAIAPVFWDTVWCLLHREVPVIRPLFNRVGIVDRVAGLCTSLLPILYDLCVISQQQKFGPTQEDMLDRIEQEIRGWSPDDSSLSLDKYSKIEILSIRTQSTMYQAAALLIIHRLRWPLMSVDRTATALANDIFAARNNFFAVAGASAKLQNACFPMFLALLEVPTAPEDIWESSTLLQTRPACVDRLFAFNQYLWEQRHSGFNGSLFDLIASGPQFVPVP